ncbi:MAG: methyltransferase domain-containing protein [Rhodobacteraceae bacterium]|nr:methyltransferase domain-containing protein [Paracoccaceae bacterium]
MLPYIGPLIQAYRQGLASDHIHLGYWEAPPQGAVTPADWREAQARLTDQILTMADLRAGLDVADAGCGIGGTLRAIRRRWGNAGRLVGINPDPRQLALCPGPAEGVALLRADALDLPLSDGCLDRVICLEAAFHFASRRGFFQQAARVLRPGGLLVLGDLLGDASGLAEADRMCAAAVLVRDFGPWPDPWQDEAGVVTDLEAAGFAVRDLRDITARTLPSYEVVAPASVSDLRHPALDGARAMRWLQENGALRYVLIAAQKPEA